MYAVTISVICRAHAAAVVLAAAVMSWAAPASAQTCFGFSMDSGAQVFRFSIAEQGIVRVYQFGPPGSPPTSFVMPYAGAPFCTWLPPQPQRPQLYPYGQQMYPWAPPWAYPPR